MPRCKSCGATNVEWSNPELGKYVLIDVMNRLPHTLSCHGKQSRIMDATRPHAQGCIHGIHVDCYCDMCAEETAMKTIKAPVNDIRELR